MKKLIIAVAIVSAAAFAQAADFNWGIAGLVNTTDTGFLADGCIGRVFSTADIARDTLMSELAVGNFDNWTKGYQENAVSGGEGTIPGLPTWASKEAGTYNWYAVVLDASTTVEAKNFYASEAVPYTLVDGKGSETSINFGDQFDIMYGNDKWTAVNNVPEPTSGLLLLLGVAGLALRRRRA